VYIGSKNQIQLLEHDVERFTLDHERLVKDTNYSKILHEMTMFSTLAELEYYWEKKRYLKDNPYAECNAPNEPFNLARTIQAIIEMIPDKVCKIEHRLTFISLDYIGTNRVLIALKERLQAEGGQISSTELGFIINIILQMSNEPHWINIILWIVNAHPQQQWLVEFVLLRIEDYYQRKMSSY
jgi:hypothetical protein